MEKVVYILGAGFSAPLGLPLMSNFIEKSKDMYFKSTNRFQHFEAIYQLIREVAYLKNFINSDLHNIEEILSILEMGHFVGDNSKELDNYKRFIKDVINFYTPQIKLDRQKQDQSNWFSMIFGEERLLNCYGFFVSNLLQLKFGKYFDSDFRNYSNYYSKTADSSKNYDYGIITLNYDLIIENFVSFINESYPLTANMKFETVSSSYDPNIDFHKLKIAKLHGCMTRDIIPPTWNKSSAHSNDVVNSWKLAYEMLVEANQIRIIGYSLPVSDSYIKYLLSVAFKNSKHLKKVDVLTFDSDKKTYERYDKLFAFPKFQFKNCKFEEFLKFAYGVERLSTKVGFHDWHDNLHNSDFSEAYMNSSILESAHEEFMKNL